MTSLGAHPAATVFVNELEPTRLHVIIEEFGFVSPGRVKSELYLRPFPFVKFVTPFPSGLGRLVG